MTMESAEQEQQQLAWSQEIPDYGNKLLKRLDEFRKTTILYDVCVHTLNGSFNAHKVILAACGGIFRTCFVDEEKKMINDAREITLNCPAQGLKPIIRFAYSGSLVVTKRNAVATMMAAEVINMKEVQEICAGIAVKEYGWVANYSGDKTSSLIEKLKKVIQIHSQCFVSTDSENAISDDTREFPFVDEVQNEMSDHVTTYRKLAEKLRSAEALALAVASRKMGKGSNTCEKNGINGNTSPDPNTVNTTSAKGKIDMANTPDVAENVISPLQQSNKVEITDEHSEEQDVTDSATILHDKVDAQEMLSDSPKSISPTLSKSANMAEHGSDNHQKCETNVPVISKDSVTESVDKSATPAATTSRDPAIPPDDGKNEKRVSTEESMIQTDIVSPANPVAPPKRTPRKDIPPRSIQNKSTSSISSAIGDTKSNGSLHGEDANSNLVKAPRREKIPAPSPKVKPRASMKVKKAPLPPPATGPTISIEKSTQEKTPTPRKSTKTPQKVPPPRPKPPVKKKVPSEADSSQKTSTNEEYDDSLNPFS